MPFGTTDWSQVPETEHPGETGTAWVADLRAGEHPGPHGALLRRATWPTTGAAGATC
ncbi:MAG: hypothetical protein MZV65_17315 [Chromatiales bacterium]|nr:hypothetical protein [Chromatiales bacterium]